MEAREEIGFLLVRVRTEVLRVIEMKMLEDVQVLRLKNFAKLRQSARSNSEKMLQFLTSINKSD